VANRLVIQRGIDINNPVNRDAEGYPIGYGKKTIRPFYLPVSSSIFWWQCMMFRLVLEISHSKLVYKIQWFDALWHLKEFQTVFIAE
jgi:hypothetical protein